MVPFIESLCAGGRVLYIGPVLWLLWWNSNYGIQPGISRKWNPNYEMGSSNLCRWWHVLQAIHNITPPESMCFCSGWMYLTRPFYEKRRKYVEKRWVIFSTYKSYSNSTGTVSKYLVFMLHVEPGEKTSLSYLVGTM